MTDLTDVLRRATDDLAPASPDLLLARAMRQGAGLRRRRRRRRLAAGSAAGLAAAACIAVGSVVGNPYDDTGAARITGHGPEPSPTVTPDRAPDPGPGPHVTVSRDALGATFARIIPGTVTQEHDVPADHVHEKGGYESSFLWNGYRVAVAMWPYAGSARQRCADDVDLPGRQQSGQTCARVPGGWSVHDRQMGETNLNRWVSVFRDNGFRVWVLIYNSGSEKGSSTTGPPPLDVPDLEKVATSPLWFS